MFSFPPCLCVYVFVSCALRWCCERVCVVLAVVVSGVGETEVLLHLFTSFEPFKNVRAKLTLAVSDSLSSSLTFNLSLGVSTPWSQLPA